MLSYGHFRGQDKGSGPTFLGRTTSSPALTWIRGWLIRPGGLNAKIKKRTDCCTYSWQLLWNTQGLRRFLCGYARLAPLQWVCLFRLASSLASHLISNMWRKLHKKTPLRLKKALRGVFCEKERVASPLSRSSILELYFLACHMTFFTAKQWTLFQERDLPAFKVIHGTNNL